MKKLISVILIVVSIFAISMPAMAATRDAPIVTVNLEHGGGPVAPCIRKEAKTGSAVLVNLSNVTSIEVRFMTPNPSWPAARYNGVVGYIEFSWLKFNVTTLSNALFTTSNLSSGDSGTAIYNLQGCLNLLGANLSLDSQFGSATKNAVKAFQSSMGLTADGIVGSATKTAIITKLKLVH